MHGSRSREYPRVKSTGCTGGARCCCRGQMRLRQNPTPTKPAVVNYDSRGIAALCASMNGAFLPHSARPRRRVIWAAMRPLRRIRRRDRRPLARQSRAASLAWRRLFLAATKSTAPHHWASTWASWPAPEPSALDMSVMGSKRRVKHGARHRRHRIDFDARAARARPFQHVRLRAAQPRQDGRARPPYAKWLHAAGAAAQKRVRARAAPTRSPVYVVPDTKSPGSDEQGEGDTIDDAIFDTLRALLPNSFRSTFPRRAHASTCRPHR